MVVIHSKLATTTEQGKARECAKAASDSSSEK